MLRVRGDKVGDAARAKAVAQLVEDISTTDQLVRLVERRGVCVALSQHHHRRHGSHSIDPWLQTRSLAARTLGAAAASMSDEALRELLDEHLLAPAVAANGAPVAWTVRLGRLDALTEWLM